MRLNFQKKPDDSIRFLITKEEKEFIKKKANENKMDMSNFIKFCINLFYIIFIELSYFLICLF